jgi:hypothetical protein
MKTWEKTCLIVAFGLVLVGIANPSLAQTQPWDTSVITWVAPTNCTTGEPITSCPIVTYRVERASSTTGTFSSIGTSGTTSLTLTGVSPGLACYRVVAVGVGNESVPSSVACKTTVRPVGPPNPPTQLKVDNIVAYNVRADFQQFAFVRGTRAGVASLGAACDETRSVGNGFYALERPSRVTPRPANGTVLVAHCG